MTYFSKLRVKIELSLIVGGYLRSFIGKNIFRDDILNKGCW